MRKGSPAKQGVSTNRWPRFRRLYHLGVVLLLLLTTAGAIQLPFSSVPGTQEDTATPKDHHQGGGIHQDNSRAGGNAPGRGKGRVHGAYDIPQSADVHLAGTLLLSMLWERGRTILQHHLKMQQKTYQQLYTLLMYKPPVGFVTVFTLIQLIASGRIFHVYNNQHHSSPIINQDNGQNGHGSISSSQNGPTIMQEEHRKTTKRRHKGRAFSLDERDQAYVSYGVMERVRGRLCVAALADIVEQEEELCPAFANDRSAIFRYKRRLLLTKQRKSHQNTTEEHFFQVPWIFGTALDALSLSCPPGGSRYDFVDQLREPLSRLRAAEVYHEAQHMSTSKDHKTSSPTVTPTILQVATMILEIRATDAILRVCRDRLLKTTYRLANTVKYWNRRVEQAKAMALIQQSLIRNTIDGDRLRLSYAQAAYHAELDRLGRICAMLLIEKHQPAYSQDSPGRPKELQDIHLLRALQRSKRANGLYQQMGATPFNGATRQEKRKWRKTWRLPKLSRYSLRIEKGRISLHHLEKDTFIAGVSAMQVLMEDDPEGLKDWYADAAAWVQSGKRTLCEVLKEAMVTSVAKNGDQHSPLSHDIEMIQEAWNAPASTMVRRTAGTDNDAEALAMAVYANTTLAWERALHVVEDVKGFRRVGEGRTVGFGELSFVGWLNEFDFFGIPFALVKIYLAYRIHEWIKPHWPGILHFLQTSWQTFIVFFLTRFWEPVKGVMLDILNKDEKYSMLEDFDLRSEEQSLDNMLKDLGYGDGTKGDRGKALEAAALQYEEDLRSNLFMTMASGQLVRLLLVQMQQLKVGMLNAIEDIDVLLQANKLNMRIMATIPAFFLVSFGTRMFARHLYNVRSRDLRPITEVHEEMTYHLYRMKSILLLANGASFGDTSQNPGVPNNSAINLVASSVKVLGPIDLGEFALRMHCYLVLLDFCSPKPFPKRQCDSLHQSIREVLGSLKKTRPEPAKSNVERSIALVDLAIKQHQGLRKYL